MRAAKHKAAPRKPVRPIHRPKARHSKPNRRHSPSTAIIVRPPTEKPWIIQSEEAVILKNAIAKGATDAEFKYCLTVARRHKLDPFQQQIWFVPRWDSEAMMSDGKKGGKVYVPQVALNGLLHVAARDHKDFGSFSEPEYGPMIEVKWQYKGQGSFKTFMAPEWARVKAYKKGLAEPTVGIVFWSEIYPNVDFSPMVRQMARRMLAKCAQAQATRLSYPSTGGLLIAEETHGPDFQNITPGGRLITRQEEPVSLEVPPESEDPKVKEYEARVAEEVKRSTAQEERKTNAVPCLFYVAQPSGLYSLEGSEVLLQKHKGSLLEFLDKPASRSAKARLMQPEQVGKLIAWGERQTPPVPIRALEASRQPGE